MKGALVLCLIVMTVFSARMSNQPILYEALTSRLKATSMGRAVLMMTELKQPNYNALFDALEGWASTIEKSIADEKASHTTLIDQINRDKQFYTDLVKEYENQVAEYQIAIRELLQSRTQLENDLDAQRKELGETKQQKSIIEQQLQDDEKNFKTETDDLNGAIVILDEVLKILEKSKYQSFIEEDVQQINNLAKEVNHKPIITNLIQVALTDYKDVENIKKVIGLLQNIRNQFALNAQLLSTQYQATKEATQEMIDQYQEKIEMISNETIPQMQQDIAGKDAELTSKKALLQEVQDDYNETRQQIDQLNGDEEHAQNTFNILIGEYHNGLDTIAECIEALHVSGIQRQ